MADRHLGMLIDGRYEVQQLIGEGGMANVYRGVDLKEGKTIALKILRTELRDNEELIRRFTNESRAISVLNHNNIVKVYDVGVSPELQYIVMEFIDGITLKQYIEQREEPLPIKECLHFVIQVLQALQHAHDKGIIHRDIKPQNIMLLRDGTLKVMDFGIARLARSEIHTATNQAIGSVHYISPEQAQGEPTDARADIYSMGIMLYEMLTGRLPFDSESAVAVAMKQISELAPPIKEVNPSVPVGLQEITEKAMAKEPEIRYQSALDMLRDVQAFRQNPDIRFEYEIAKEDAVFREEKMNIKNQKPSGVSGKPSTTGAKKKKKKKDLLIPVAAGITAAFMLVSMFICLEIFRASGNPLFGTVPTVEIPNVVNMLKQDGVDALVTAGISQPNISFEERIDEDLPHGTIISQSPANLKVKKTQKIVLIISTGQEEVTVPDTIGMLRRDAQNLILEKKLRPYIRILYDNSKPAGTVDSTSPAPGTLTYSGEIVTIYVYAQKITTETVVPDLIGLASQADAKRMLNEVGLDLSANVDEEFSEAEVGSVIKQYPKAGEKVSMFTSIKIVVSKGPEPPAPELVNVPDLTGRSFDQAKRMLEDLGLVVQEEGVEGNIEDLGKVVGQSVGGEVEKGTVVVLKVVRTVASSAAPASSAPPASPAAGPAALFIVMGDVWRKASLSA